MGETSEVVKRSATRVVDGDTSMDAVEEMTSEVDLDLDHATSIVTAQTENQGEGMSAHRPATMSLLAKLQHVPQDLDREVGMSTDHEEKIDRFRESVITGTVTIDQAEITSMSCHSVAAGAEVDTRLRHPAVG